MEGEKLRENVEKEYERCQKELRKIDLEIAKLQGKKECYEDRRVMLWDLINREN